MSFEKLYKYNITAAIDKKIIAKNLHITKIISIFAAEN